MTKEEISNLLYEQLADVYCYNCRGDSEEPNADDLCEYCNRKGMNWEISRHEADRLAELIMKGDNKNEASKNSK